MLCNARAPVSGNEIKKHVWDQHAIARYNNIS